MGRPHPIHVVTLLLAALATVFSFVAMRVAFDARDEAAASSFGDSGGDNWYQINQLQDALVRAGVIEDPAIVPDDHHELGGPWARCLTAGERDEMGLGADEVDLPSPPCRTVTVTQIPCDVPPPEERGDDAAGVDDWDCELVYRFDGRDYYLADSVHPTDLEAQVDAWFNVDGAPEIDRLVRVNDGEMFLHLIDHGWFLATRDDW